MDTNLVRQTFGRTLSSVDEGADAVGPRARPRGGERRAT